MGSKGVRSTWSTSGDGPGRRLSVSLPAEPASSAPFQRLGQGPRRVTRRAPERPGQARPGQPGRGLRSAPLRTPSSLLSPSSPCATSPAPPPRAARGTPVTPPPSSTRLPALSRKDAKVVTCPVTSAAAQEASATERPAAPPGGRDAKPPGSGGLSKGRT